MRCKNCGWDNPVDKTKCGKCNAPLSGSMVIEESFEQKLHTISEGFSPQTTVRGCPYDDCGYPIKPSDTECPNCGRSLVEGPKPSPEVNPERYKEEPGRQKTIRIINRLVGFLVTYSHSPIGEFYPLYEGRNTIGRDASNDIIIPDELVSGRHLEIAYYPQDKTFYFEVIGLTQNGTHVNDRFFPRGGGELNNHDIIFIGSTKIIFITIPEK